MAQKKSFKANLDNLGDINPAMRFISRPEQEPKENNEKGGGNLTGVQKPNPLYVETKSRRLQLLLQPSLYGKIKVRARRDKKSINQLVCLILEEALKDGEG